MKFIITLLFVIAFSMLNAQISDAQIKQFVGFKSEELKLEDCKLTDIIITDNYTSQGINHVYFKQSFNGIEIYKSYGAIHGKEENLSFDNSGLFRGISNSILKSDTGQSIELLLTQLAKDRNYSLNFDLTQLSTEPLNNQKAVYQSNALSSSPIKTRLVYIQTSKNNFELARIITIDEVNSDDYFEFLVDVKTGKVLEEYNYTVYCNFDHGKGSSEKHTHKDNSNSHLNHNYFSGSSENLILPNQYNVYAYPIESPLYGSQTIVTSPWLAGSGTASPNGWHNYGTNNFTTTKGNNVDAYLDIDNSNTPTNGDDDRAQGGVDLEFLFVYDTLASVSDFTNQRAAITNLFYWNNLVHDMWFEYGFDEASGNFQEENYGTQGVASDFVNAHAQDGGGTCNANMSTPSDGGNPRMQMYLCNGKDGDLDNGVIVHEYTHGISNRLTGGPSAANCLGNQEQMGEGWSDYFGIIMTIEPGDSGTDPRPIGNWLFGQSASGGGIRTYPYSTDMAINPFTYDNIKTQSVPHGVGSVWATMLWDLNWALIGEYGFDSDFYLGTGGNNIAMKLVLEGMKLQPCSPGFVDGRDAILLADMNLYGGVNQCLIWQVFANRGLGYSANQGSSGSRSDGTEAFDLPPTCNIQIVKTANVTQVAPGDTITYTFTITNNATTAKTNLLLSDELPANTSFISASNSGINTNGIVSYPPFNLAIGEVLIYSMQVKVDLGVVINIPDFMDNMESGSSLWLTTASGSTSFNLSTAQSSSPVTSWFAPDPNTTGVASIYSASPLFISSTSILSFSHNYNTEATWDGGVVEISLDYGNTWIDLIDDFTSNGYNSTINNSRPAFSGNSNGFITSIADLSPYAGQVALIRFQMNCDAFVGGVGWYIDDVIVTNQELLIPNIAMILDGTDEIFGYLQNPTKVINVEPLVISSEIIDPSCKGLADGSIDLTITGGYPNPQILYSNGATTEDISGLVEGIYYVSVNDGTTTVYDTITIHQSQATVYLTSGESHGTLEYAVNNACITDTIVFEQNLLNQIIYVDEQLNLRNNQHVKGLGMQMTMISGNDANRIFNINTASINSISDLTLMNAYEMFDGGAILNNGKLTLTNVKFSNNKEGLNSKSMTNKANLFILGDVNIED